MAEDRPKPKKPGPEPDRLVIEGLDWEEAADKLLEKKRPPEGWPEPEKRGEERERPPKGS